VGNTGILSFGHVGFGSIAGYTFAALAIDVDQKARVLPKAPFGLGGIELHPVWATLAAIVVTLVAASVIGIGLSRSGAQSGAVSATVITLALLFVAHEVARNWTELTGGERAGLTFAIGDTLKSQWVLFLLLIPVVIVARLFATSRTGRLAIAGREDNLAVRAIGANPLRQQMAALLVSAAVVAIASSLRVYQLGTILPDSFFFDYTLLTLVMLVVGGRNSVTGALLGVVTITVGRELARRMGGEGFAPFGFGGFDSAPLDWIFREGLPTVFLGGAMLGFMILRPKGLIDDWELDVWAYRRWGQRLGLVSSTAPEPLAEMTVPSPARLQVDAVDVRFGGFQALDQATLEANQNEIVGIIGPNGAGKTTLVNVVTGLVEPTGGQFSLDETPLNAAAPFQIARHGLARTFQNLRLFGSLTVRENVEAAAIVARQHRSGHPLPDVDALIAEAGLWEHRDRRAQHLDYGNARRLELARAAAMSPTFLLLDEPTSGMSENESVAMIEQVRHMAATVGAGVIVIDHDLAFITGISDRIYVLDQGRVIAEGTPDEVQADQRVRDAYLGA